MSQISSPHRVCHRHVVDLPNGGQVTTLHVLRVFCNESGEFGNRLGVVLDGPAIPPERRQALAAELGFSETVYVDDTASGRLRIFTPAAELPLAGHPLVGTSWLLSRHTGSKPDQLLPPAGPIPTWWEGPRVWIRAPIAAAPPWGLHELADAATVDAMTGPPAAGFDADQFWAWIDAGSGSVRARVFARRYGVHEDEACGSACLLLTHHAGRDLTVLHGNGSLIYARPAADGMAEIGGYVVQEELREVS
jgi:predicted PhzF superfamily epimerase YddE/YHI9